MSRWRPCKRRSFIRRLRKLGFDGPLSGTRHQFMLFQQHRLAIPSNPEYSVPQLRIMLREIAEILGREISVDEWNRLGRTRQPRSLGLCGSTSVKSDRPECVVLAHDTLEHGLRGGDLGTALEVYPKGGMEVEFVRGSGATQALCYARAALRLLVGAFGE